MVRRPTHARARDCRVRGVRDKACLRYRTAMAVRTPTQHLGGDTDTCPVTTVIVNGRYRTMPMTGTQRYADELARRLPGAMSSRVLMAVPPGSVIDVLEVDAVETTESFSGLRGHAWEQLQLPRLLARHPHATLLGLANWGPLLVRRQVVAVLDLAPLRFPHFYSPAYVRLTRSVQPRLARRARRVITLSESTKREISETYHVAPGRIDIVPPGVGEPFTDSSFRRDPNSQSVSCVFVGAHDPRKNLGFLLRLWPRVVNELGLTLHVTVRGASGPHAGVPLGDHPGVVVHENIDDLSLATLYRDALCVLSPSHYEGFGLPLLEAMATGTPFLASRAGAAEELAVDPLSQILPLDAERWLSQLRRWAGGDLAPVREASVQRAAKFDWDASAALLAESLGKAQSVG